MRVNLLVLTLLILFAGVRQVFASSLVMNEFMANPNDDTEWIELYNPTSQAVDLSNWKLKDGNSLTNDDLTLSGQINPNSFITFDHAKGWLNDSGSEVITLLDNNGQTIDSYTYSGTTKGKAYGRQPDGSNWIANLDPSKGSTNGGASSTPIPTSTPTPTPSPTQSPSSTDSPSSSFIISNIPSHINSDQNFTASIQLVLPSNPSTNFYLKGAFKKSDGSNYFGQTLVSGSWVKNGSNYSSQFPVTTDSSGNWSGNLEVKPDSEDSGFTGTGDYVFKVARYTSQGSGPTWSNEFNINIAAISSTSNDIDSSPTPEPSDIQTPQPTSILTKATTSPKFNYQIASVAGASNLATPSGKIEIKSHKQTNFLFWAGIILVFAGISSIGYIYIRKNADTRIQLRKRI